MGSFTARNVNAGTHLSVIVDTTPSAPSPTRAAANTSGFSAREHVSAEPSPVTSSIASTNVESAPSFAPVPCVPVESAPEIV